MEPRLCADREAQFDANWPKICLKHNRELIKKRTRNDPGYSCPKGYPNTFPCYQCAMGYRQCGAATHAKPWQLQLHARAASSRRTSIPNRPAPSVSTVSSKGAIVPPISKKSLMVEYRLPTLYKQTKHGVIEWNIGVAAVGAEADLVTVYGLSMVASNRSTPVTDLVRQEPGPAQRHHGAPAGRGRGQGPLDQAEGAQELRADATGVPDRAGRLAHASQGVREGSEEGPVGQGLRPAQARRLPSPGLPLDQQGRQPPGQLFSARGRTSRSRPGTSPLPWRQFCPRIA